MDPNNPMACCCVASFGDWNVMYSIGDANRAMILEKNKQDDETDPKIKCIYSHPIDYVIMTESLEEKNAFGNPKKIAEIEFTTY